MHIFPVFLFLHVAFGQQAWIDPHSMDINTESIIIKKNKHSLSSTEPQCKSDIHMRRIINLILTNAHFEEYSTGFMLGHINIRLSADDYQFLTSKSNDYFKISSILERAVEKTPQEKFMDFTLSIQERLYLVVFNPYSGSLMGMVLFLFIVYKLLKAQFSWRTITRYLIFMAYVFDLVINYLDIIREEEIKNIIKLREFGSVIPECDPQKMSWGTFLTTKLVSTFSQHPCKEYYEATYKNDIWMVAPSKVLSRQLKNVIIQPLEYLGEGLGKFSTNLYKSLPSFIAWLMYPFLMLLSIVFFFIIFIFITNKKFKISLPLISFELGSTPTNQKRNRNRSVDFQPRKMVEDVTNLKKQTKRKKIEKKEPLPINDTAANKTNKSTTLEENSS